MKVTTPLYSFNSRRTQRTNAANDAKPQVPEAERAAASQRLREQVIQALKTRLADFGWTIKGSGDDLETHSFDDFDPPADAVFSAGNPHTGECRPVALHFVDGAGAIQYACTMRRPNGQTFQEHGRIDAGNGAITVNSVANWPFAAATPVTAPDRSDLREPGLPPQNSSAPRPLVRVLKKAGSSAPPPASKTMLRITPAPAKPVAQSVVAPAASGLDTRHPMLQEILERVAASGSHVQRWSTLKKTVFPEGKSWVALKAWCGMNAIACQIGFGQSSKEAEVQFRTAPQQASAQLPG